MYFKSDSYTDPTGEDAEYDFSGFLPYVAASYSENNYHEIKVNQTAMAELDTGCGTYNDPYIISQGKQLELLDKILSNNLGDSEDGAVVNYQENSYSAWCNEKTAIRFCYGMPKAAALDLRTAQQALSLPTCRRRLHRLTICLAMM